MEFKDIEYVCAIEEHKSITKAAESLFIAQPTLSQYIKNMQKRLGVRLFRNEGNQILLTYEGERFAAEGTKLLQDRDILVNNLISSQKKGHGLLRIAIPLARGSYLLPLILPKFHAIYPHAQIKLQEDSSRNLVNLIKEGLSDIVLINKPRFPLNIEYETLGYERMLLVMNRESPYKSKITYNDQGQACIGITDCSDASFILHQPYQHTGQLERCIFKNAGISPNVILETKNLVASYRLAAAGYGLTFLSEHHINHLKNNNEAIYCQIPDPIANSEFIAGYKNKKELSFLSREFIRILTENMPPM